MASGNASSALEEFKDMKWLNHLIYTGQWDGRSPPMFLPTTENARKSFEDTKPFIDDTKDARIKQIYSRMYYLVTMIRPQQNQPVEKQELDDMDWLNHLILTEKWDGKSPPMFRPTTKDALAAFAEAEEYIKRVDKDKKALYTTAYNAAKPRLLYDPIRDTMVPQPPAGSKSA